MGDYNYHEHFSLTSAYTGMLLSWLEEAEVQSSKKASFKQTEEPKAFENTYTGFQYNINQMKGRYSSRALSSGILPIALVDTILHLALGALTILALAPLEAGRNAVQHLRGKECTNYFSFKGGLANLANAVKHVALIIPALFVGAVNPRITARWFETKIQVEKNAKDEAAVSKKVNAPSIEEIKIAEPSPLELAEEEIDWNAFPFYRDDFESELEPKWEYDPETDSYSIAGSSAYDK